MKQKRLWKKPLAALLTGSCGLVLAASAVADIGTEIWQKTYTPTSSYHQGFFLSVGFNTDGSVLANGYRSEADSGSAIGIRYEASNGDVRDTPPEWFLFEPSYGDYTHDRFYDQHIDSSGNIYFVGIGYPAVKNTGSVRYNIPNIWKYDSAYNNPGTPDRPLWRQYHVDAGVPAHNGQFSSMAVDNSDNIIAVGWFNNLASATSNRDWIIDKYDSDGTRAAGFPLSFNKDNLHDFAYDVATDSQGNFIVAGAVIVDDTTDHYDWVVRKYQSDGTLLWEASYDFAGGNDQAFSVVVDSEDNIIVGGYRTQTSPEVESDWYVVKYQKDADINDAAVILWEQSWDNGNFQNGIAKEMVLDESDNVFIIGMQKMDSVSPAFTDRYRPVLQYRDGQTGTLLKSQDIEISATHNNVPASEDEFPQRIALSNGQLVIAGYTQQDGGWSVQYGKTGRVIMLSLLSDVTPSSSGNGSISPLAVVEDVPFNTTTAFTLTPDPGFSPAPVPVTGTCAPGVSPTPGATLGTWDYTTGPITSDCTVIANFCDPATVLTYYKDADGDLYSDGTTLLSCNPPAGYYLAASLTSTSGDCDDSNAAINPDATEVCDGIDNNCDAQIDEGLLTTFYQDADSDTYGKASVSQDACTAPAGYVTDNTDCDDSNAAINPGATEVCDGVDNNCDTQIDEGLLTTYYQDADVDTYGNNAVSQATCTQPGGYVLDNTDCDDEDANEHPGQTWYKDEDGDGYSDGTTDTASCERPAGYYIASELLETSGDPDDTNPAIIPGAPWALFMPAIIGNRQQ